MGTIYFFAEDVSAPAGGILAMYRFVDILNLNGIEASMLHRSSKFRCEWFSNNTRISGLDKTIFTTQDVLVLTELQGHCISSALPGLNKVVLNNHQYWTFLNGNAQYRDPSVRLVLAVSQDGREYLEFAFPGVNVDRVHYGIGPDEFCSRVEERQRRIVYRSSKNPFVTAQIERLWKERNRHSDWSLLPLTNTSHSEVAAAMRSSAVFLATSQYEGFQIMAAEAQLAGMLVVGFHAGGGREFLQPGFSYLVEQGDIIEFVRSIEEAMNLFDNKRSEYDEMTGRASALIRKITSPDLEASDVLRIFPAILKENASTPARKIGKLNLPRVSRTRRVARQLRLVGRELRR